jgi:hypothetical protein
MKHIISTHLAKGLVRASAVASMVVTFGVGSIGPSGLGLLGVSGLSVTIATPAQARCLIKGVMRSDIADSDCQEAQRTGCVRKGFSSLAAYQKCLDAQVAVQRSGQECYVSGAIRRDLSAADCAEAKATGCVRRLLSPAGYTDCLNKQPVGRR